MPTSTKDMNMQYAWSAAPLLRAILTKVNNAQDKPKKTIYDKPETLCLVKKTIVSDREIFEMTEYDFKEDSEYSESSDYE